MKQNAVGLANICVLSTIVLVMLSSTVCLYVGIEGTVNDRYPRNICIEGYLNDKIPMTTVEGIVKDEANKLALTISNLLSYRSVSYTTDEKNGKIADSKFQDGIVETL